MTTDCVNDGSTLIPACFIQVPKMNKDKEFLLFLSEKQVGFFVTASSKKEIKKTRLNILYYRQKRSSVSLTSVLIISSSSKSYFVIQFNEIFIWFYR